MARGARATLTVLVLLALTGCWPEGVGESQSTEIVGFGSETALLEHYPAWSGWTTLPSTLWQIDLSTGTGTQVGLLRSQYDVQAAGDYVVTEVPTDDDLGSRIVATQISTGDEFTLLERNAQLGGRYDKAFVLTGAQAVLRTDSGLRVYDLPSRTAVLDVPVADPLREILAAGSDYALVRRFSFAGEALLVHLGTAAVLELPEVAADRAAYLADAVFTADAMITTGWRTSGDEIVGHDLLRFDIDARTWDVVLDLGAREPGRFWAGMATIADGEDEFVVLQNHVPARSGRIELVDLSSGLRTVVLEQATALVGLPRPHLHTGKVYWLDRTRPWLVSHDIVTGQRAYLTLDLPFDL